MRVHVASPRGQARAPTWRGGDVALTWTLYISLLSGSPVYRETNIQTYTYVVHYILEIFRDLFRVGLIHLSLFDFRTRGAIGSVG